MPGEEGLEFTAKVRSSFRITIPEWIREEMKIEKNSVVKLVLIRKVK